MWSHCGMDRLMHHLQGQTTSNISLVVRKIVNMSTFPIALTGCWRMCRADDQHCPRTSLVCIESTHNRCGGCVLSLDYMRSLKTWADSLVRPSHLFAKFHCSKLDVY